MPTYKITAPDGTVLKITGDTPPNEQQLNEIFSKVQGNQTETQKQEPAKKGGIDLTPSGLLDKASMGAFSALATPVEMIRSKEINPIEAYKNVYDATDKMMADVKKQSPVLSGAKDFGIDMLGYSKIPVLKGNNIPQNIGAYLGNIATQGTLTGALEGLKSGNVGEGATIGSLVAGAMQGAPIAAKGIGKVAGLLPQTGGLIAQTLGRVQPETLQRAIQADSKALDLNKNTAQNLLMNTTERVQNDYKQLLDNAGLEVQKAALNLPEERGVFASSLKNALDDIYNGYSTSGVRELNPAFNNAGDIYDDISALIKAGATGEKVSAKNLNDIMGNLKNYPIDWNKTSAKDRQSILKQIYSDYARRLGNLSPELRKANRVYSKLANFQNNEGLKSIINPNVMRGENIDSASRTLRNYNSTVSSGNKNRNIQDLENLLVKEGKQPFLNDIDDVNAAMDLLNIRGTGTSWLANLVTQGTRPVLKMARKANQMELPQKVETIQQLLKPYTDRLPMLGAKAAANMLYGGVEYNDYK